MKRTIAIFDFDGTITTKDTFGLFARFTVGSWHYLCATILTLPEILLWKLGIKSGGFAKQHFFKRLYAGMTLHAFADAGQRFINVINSNLNPETIKRIEFHCNSGHKVYIVSASIGTWIRPWAAIYGINVISTEPQIGKDNRLTGLFATPNCNGDEKVRRFLALEPDRNSYTLYAYGDSHGDSGILRLADHATIV